MISAITLKGGKATFRNRYVQTKGFVKEQKLRKITQRSPYGTGSGGGMFSGMFESKPKNVGNTNVFYWSKRLLALTEGSRPYKVEPDSLRTSSEGEYTLRGLLDNGAAFGAYPKIDTKRNRLINFSTTSSSKASTLIIYEFDSLFKVTFERYIG